MQPKMLNYLSRIHPCFQRTIGSEIGTAVEEKNSKNADDVLLFVESEVIHSAQYDVQGRKRTDDLIHNALESPVKPCYVAVD
jgi:hypothetical protein